MARTSHKASHSNELSASTTMKVMMTSCARSSCYKEQQRNHCVYQSLKSAVVPPDNGLSDSISLNQSDCAAIVRKGDEAVNDLVDNQICNSHAILKSVNQLDGVVRTRRLEHACNIT
eukprot:3319631-Amphidinium_carterae.1